jgi:AraC family transcriptional regulator of adaptative response/methylated-DNA-[protein]-cysteine methyltransferase
MEINNTDQYPCKITIGTSSLGGVLVVENNFGITNVEFSIGMEYCGNPKAEFNGLKYLLPYCNNIISTDSSPVLDEVLNLIENPKTILSSKMVEFGTPFQRKVLAEVSKIPAGQTRSYRDVAMALGMPKAARAVANACASNRIAVAIPCHRVVACTGALSGYAWGVERKQALLARER